jgi:hypothetical protein
MFLLFLPHFLGAPAKRGLLLPRQAAAFWEGPKTNHGEEPGKQKPRSCRAQELARSSPQEKERQKKTWRPPSDDSRTIEGSREEGGAAARTRCAFRPLLPREGGGCQKEDGVGGFPVYGGESGSSEKQARWFHTHCQRDAPVRCCRCPAPFRWQFSWPHPSPGPRSRPERESQIGGYPGGNGGEEL